MIKQAIIPLAGLGTRMLPLTSVMPKELLPINGKPNLEYILEECLDAGVKQFIFIISKKKMNIKNFPKTSDITLNYENGWLDIHLNNVENRNALKQNLIKELFTVFDVIRNNKDVRGVLIIKWYILCWC